MAFNEEIVCCSTEYNKVELKNVALKKHDMYGYCLDVTYRVERSEDIVDVNIPWVRLPIMNDYLTIKTERFPHCSVVSTNFGLGELEVIHNIGEAVYTIKTIKTKTKEMTLEEIEKKLGHKVKIVSDKK